jgi:hypothetical protein
MANFASFTAPALAPIVLLGLIGAAAASEYKCVRGDQSVRRVEVASEDPVQNVPCEVVYWKDTEQPGVRRVLWSAETDAAYCARKADDLVATLEDGGWSCARVEGAAAEAARETTPSVVEAPPSEPEPEPEAESAGAAGAARLESARDEAAKESEPADQGGPAVRAALAPQPAEPQPDASAVLEAIIEQNLVRLNDGVEGRFAADIGGFGDLDGDGLEDGLVFFTYESERLGQARFIAAYLYDGESYALAATKPVAGSDDNVQSANIDSIDDGVISLRLGVLEPGDASCCPSGERRQRLLLRDGQLVEIKSSASLTPGQAAKRSQETLALAVARADPSGEPEERAEHAGAGRAAATVESAAEPAERSLETAATGDFAATGLPIVNTGMPKEAERTESRPTTGHGGGSRIDRLQVAADPAVPGPAAKLQLASQVSSSDDRPAADIRVFIHYVAHREADAALARRLADHLQRRGFTVADVRAVDFSIGKPSVRYFFAPDRAASWHLVEEVSRFFEETPAQAAGEASDFTHYMPKPRPGNVEVWLPVS